MELSFAKFCGLPAEKMLHMHVTDFVCKEDKAAVAKGVLEVFTRGTATLEVKLLNMMAYLYTSCATVWC